MVYLRSWYCIGIINCGNSDCMYVGIKLDGPDSWPRSWGHHNNGTEFRNALLENFCIENGITQQFFAPRTPQKNGVVERKNRTLIEAARKILQDVDLPTSFWAEAMNTTCYIQNRTLINKSIGNRPYFIMRGRNTTSKNLHVFGSKCYILKDNSEHIGKFDSKSYWSNFSRIFLGRIAYRVYVIDH